MSQDSNLGEGSADKNPIEENTNAPVSAESIEHTREDSKQTEEAVSTKAGDVEEITNTEVVDTPAEETSVETTVEESVESAPVEEKIEAAAIDDTQVDAADEKAQDEEVVEDEWANFQIDNPDNANMKWYMVNCYSGYEKRAKKSLEDRIAKAGEKEKFGYILIPKEQVVELVRGKKKSTERKFFPGYILVQMEVTPQTWYVVNDTPRISGFVGNAKQPAALPKREIERITKQMMEGEASARPRYNYKEGDSVKVIDGPFSNFNGTVEEVKPDKSKLRVLVSIFGRATPVELDFIQVKKS